MQTSTPKTKIIRQLRSGQITIPIEFRRELHLEGEGLLQLTLDNGELRIKPVHVTARPESEGSSWFKELYDYFAPVRQEAIEKGYTEEEINAWIDQAIGEVRHQHD